MYFAGNIGTNERFYGAQPVSDGKDNRKYGRRKRTIEHIVASKQSSGEAAKAKFIFIAVNLTFFGGEGVGWDGVRVLATITPDHCIVSMSLSH